MTLNLLLYCTKGYSRRILAPCSHTRRFLNTNVKHTQLYKQKDDKKKELKVYLLTRLIQYIKNYDVHIKEKFPKATEVYKVFMEGVKVFYEDLKNYMKILRIVFESSSVNPLEKLTRKELELYHQLPKDIFKVGPILVASALPFSLYLILPLVYYYPRQLLTSHFWTLQQKSEFKVVLLKNRLLHNKPVFRHLQLQLNNLEDHPLREDWACILGQLGSGVQPSVEQILTCKPLFMKLPYRLNYLSGNHTKHLRKMHNSWYFFKRRNLRDTAIILMAMDKAIMREGGVHNMPVDSLKHACYIRGLNPTHVKNEDLVDWLNQWIKISQKIDKDSYSLLLHCPILLGYNQPSNWSLIYPYKD